MQLPLNVSPVSASFFGLQRQGIHLVLSKACSLLLMLGSLDWFSCVLEMCDATPAAPVRGGQTRCLVSWFDCDLLLELLISCLLEKDVSLLLEGTPTRRRSAKMKLWLCSWKGADRGRTPTTEEWKATQAHRVQRSRDGSCFDLGSRSPCGTPHDSLERR
jgi:hypothetical protein